MAFDPHAEWLETDGLGGFASGTAGDVRSRRYHALLLAAARPPADRWVLVNGVEAWIETPGGTIALTTQRYAPDVLHPDGASRIADFDAEPWPAWTYRLDGGASVVHERFVPGGTQAVVLSWRARALRGPATLCVRPLLSGRDPHALHHENGAFRFDSEPIGERLVWRPYDGVPGIVAWSNGTYEYAPQWYRNFRYTDESARGLDDVEDLASPGIFRIPLGRTPAQLVLAAALTDGVQRLPCAPIARTVAALRTRESRRRRRFPTPLHRAADAYLARREGGRTVIAGYPWFGDWGRDTFIAVRGLCMATGRWREAGEILGAWTGAVSRGMLPNRFPDRGEEPEYNSVDAALWYVLAVGEYLAGRGSAVPARERAALVGAVRAIVDGMAAGTRYGIRLDGDGLLAAGEPGVQLTWMDAKIGDWVVTPRIGKPVEIQALWASALDVTARLLPEAEAGPYLERLARCRASFEARFWSDDRGYLADVADVDHRGGETDWTFRPNQLFAAGGLPLSLLDTDRARRVVDEVERRLWTPLGPRSLAPGENGYSPRYQGGPRERDSVYHQGTVWPWLAGPFVEAWVRAHGGDAAARARARERFLPGLLRHLGEAGLGHVSEIADADPPHTPRGCPFQAWSVGELLRLVHRVLAEPKRGGGERAPAAGRPRAGGNRLRRAGVRVGAAAS